MYSYLEKKTVTVCKIVIFFLLFLGFSSTIYAATLSVTPATGDFETGERVVVKVVTTSNNVPFNAVSSLISFPTSIFSIESVSKTNSVLNFWVTEPFISRSAGTVKFEGVALIGFSLGSGTVLTVNLRAVKAGSGKVSFQSGQILANDGEGTDITGNLIGAMYSVKDAVQKVAPPKKELPIPEPPSIPEAVQPKPSLQAPEIMLGEKYGARSIVGTSKYPNAQMLVTFLASDGVKVFIIGTSDDFGSFNLLVPSSLKRGLYTVTAILVQEDRTNSETSNAIFVEVGNLLFDLDWKISLLLLLLILFIIYLILRTHFHFEQNRNRKTSIEKELRGTENIVHKSFDILREDVIGYDKEQLTNTERKQILGIKKDINDAEKLIIKEIKNLEP